MEQIISTRQVAIIVFSLRERKRQIQKIIDKGTSEDFVIEGVKAEIPDIDDLLNNIFKL